MSNRYLVLKMLIVNPPPNKIQCLFAISTISSVKYVLFTSVMKRKRCGIDNLEVDTYTICIRTYRTFIKISIIGLVHLDVSHCYIWNSCDGSLNPISLSACFHISKQHLIIGYWITTCKSHWMLPSSKHSRNLQSF